MAWIVAISSRPFAPKVSPTGPALLRRCGERGVRKSANAVGTYPRKRCDSMRDEKSFPAHRDRWRPAFSVVTEKGPESTPWFGMMETIDGWLMEGKYAARVERLAYGCAGRAPVCRSILDYADPHVSSNARRVGETEVGGAVVHGCIAFAGGEFGSGVLPCEGRSHRACFR